MKIIKSVERIHSDLKSAFQFIDSNSVMLHTDLTRVGFSPKAGSIQEQLKIICKLLVDSTEGRTLLFPTFNYNFCKSGFYNVNDDPCQVGIINEYFRKNYIGSRTQTPIFNFFVVNNTDYNILPVKNVFSELSTFGELVKKKASIIFLGAPLSSNTFAHHVEEVMNIGYRYLKPFKGKIIYGEEVKNLTVKYRVRPMFPGAAEKDWVRLNDDLIDAGLLLKESLGNGSFLACRADKLLDYWCSKIDADEHYLLTEESRTITQELYDKYGRPLQYSAVEHAL